MSTRIALALVLSSLIGPAGCTVKSQPASPPPPPPDTTAEAPPPPMAPTPAPAPEPAPAPQPPPPAEPPPPPRWDPAGWTLLGETVVNGKKDKDTIKVGKKEGTFTRLMLVVEDSELEMRDVKIVFGKGKPWSPEVKHFFRENDRTRAIDLPGDQRFIKKIEFRYGNLPGGGKARVQAWAKEGTVGGVEGGQVGGPDRKAKWDRNGWEMLGETRVDGKKDRDVVKVGKKEGKFTRLMLVVEDSDLEMTEVTVTFGNKKQWSPEVKHFFREEDRTRVIDLPGEQRFIQKIEFRYGNLAGGGKASVQVWAK